MDLNDQLFDSDYSHLPSPFQGETLYGWCARFHRLNSSASARLTSRHLFNHSVAGLRHDFPTHLETFSNNTNQLLGTIEELIHGRTPFGIFAPFLSSDTTKAIINDMRQVVHTQVKYHLGILPSRIGTAAPLKACPSCIRIDAKISKVAWWHAEHQWPTVMTCPEHGDYLMMATPEFHARLLKDWFLPTDLCTANWHEGIKLPESTITKLRKLSDWSLNLAKRYKNPFDSELLRLTYHLRAKSKGWTFMDGSLKFNQIRLAFRDQYTCLENLPGFSFIQNTTQEHGGFIGSTLRQFEGNKHPLKHVIMMDFLFGDFDIFIAEYERLLAKSIELDRSELWSELTESRNQLKLLVSEAGYSVNAAAKQLGLPIGQALVFLRKEGVEYKRRPRVLNPQIEVMLRQLCEAGEDREMIATKLEIKNSFVRDYLQNDSELCESWHHAYQKRLLEKHRSSFIQLRNDHPDLSTKQMKQIQGNGIQWLQRHDKDWLGMHLPSLWS